MKHFFSASLLLTLLTLLTESQALSVSECVSRGYESCLNKYGNCAEWSSDCSDTCYQNSQCFFDCCSNGYCSIRSMCTSTSTSVDVIGIILPIVFGVILIFLFSICYVIRKRRLAALRAKMQANQNNMNTNMEQRQTTQVVTYLQTGEYGQPTAFENNQIPVGYNPNNPMLNTNSVVLLNMPSQQRQQFYIQPNMNAQMYPAVQPQYGVQNPIGVQQYPNSNGVNSYL